MLYGAASLGSNVTKLFGVAGSVHSVLRYLKQRPPIEQEGGEELETFRGEIQFANVSWASPTHVETWILQEVSFNIPANSFAAFVGPSGSGKSTTIQLIERFYDPEIGEVLIDGRDIKTLSLQWLRQHIAFVTQEPVVLARSIRENVVYGFREAKDMDKDKLEDAIHAACRKAAAYDFIADLPDGFNTVVGQGSAGLSGGQRQRICLARAFLKDPRILMLDEATAALDSASEEIVQQNLMELAKTRTLIAVAHRLSTIKDADNIFVMQAGRLIDHGTHQQLIESCVLYKHFVETQNGTHSGGTQIHI